MLRTCRGRSCATAPGRCSDFQPNRRPGRGRTSGENFNGQQDGQAGGLWHIYGTQGWKRLFTSVSQRQRTTHESADRQHSERVSAVLLVGYPFRCPVRTFASWRSLQGASSAPRLVLGRQREGARLGTWALDPGRFDGLGTRGCHHLPVGKRRGARGVLRETVEQQAPSAGVTAVEAEAELFEVGLQVLGLNLALMGAHQPTLAQGLEARTGSITASRTPVSYTHLRAHET